MKLDVDTLLLARANPLDLMVQNGKYWLHTREIALNVDCGATIMDAVASYTKAAACEDGRPEPFDTPNATTFYGNFIAGWLGLFQSPQLLAFSEFWYAWPGGWSAAHARTTVSCALRLPLSLSLLLVSLPPHLRSVSLPAHCTYRLFLPRRLHRWGDQTYWSSAIWVANVSRDSWIDAGHWRGTHGTQSTPRDAAPSFATAATATRSACDEPPSGRRYLNVNPGGSPTHITTLLGAGRALALTFRQICNLLRRSNFRAQTHALLVVT